jgi:hypothetical protein
VVHHVVDNEPLRLLAGRLQRDGELHGPADRNPLRREGEARFAAQRGAEAPRAQHPRFAAFDQAAARVLEQRAAFARRRGQVRGEPVGDHPGMVLGDIVQVVGDAAAHVLARVVLQRFEQRQRRPRIGDQELQLHAPRQARPAALADQAAHVRARVGEPATQRREGEVAVLEQERAQRVLGGEALRQRVQGQQRARRLGEPDPGHEIGHRPDNPTGEPGGSGLQGTEVVVAARRGERRLDRLAIGRESSGSVASRRRRRVGRAP